MLSHFFMWCRTSSADVLVIVGSMYAAVMFVGCENCITVQPLIAVERTVFYRERAAGMYSAIPYALSQVSNIISSIDLRITV
jgi:hypothetical protein